MQEDALRQLLDSVRRGDIATDDALARLRNLPFESIDFARIDHHRSLRCGFPEVIYCEGKTPEQVAEIFDRLARSGAPVLATRAAAEHATAIHAKYPNARHEKAARCVVLSGKAMPANDGLIALVAAGTSDLPVIEEARVTCELTGQPTCSIYDVGIAGLHRLLGNLKPLHEARVIVVAAGMDGALPAVVKGLVRAPVIAVPTSVGYGASFGGLAPLLTMLNACAPGVAVVNIDNGFAAGYLATLINRIGSKTDGSD